VIIPSPVSSTLVHADADTFSQLSFSVGSAGGYSCFSPSDACAGITGKLPFAGNGLEIAANLFAGGTPGFTSQATASMNMTLQFFEADGITPMNISEPQEPSISVSPEPSSAVMVLLSSLLGSICVFHRRLFKR
jgi:hypothetical protein